MMTIGKRAVNRLNRLLH